MADGDGVTVPPRLGRLVPPYPVKRCASSECRRELLDDMAVFLFTDLESQKLVVLCEDCTIEAELHHRHQFTLVAL